VQRQRQLARARAGLDVAQGDGRALGLGDDLVSHRDDLTVAQPSVSGRRGDQRREILTGANLRQAAQAAG
jgi:hypothetical protein